MIDEKVKEFSERAYNVMSSLGIPQPQRPTSDLVFPDDLGSIPDQDLSKHLTYWSSMCGYVIHKCSMLDGSLTLAKRDLDQEYDLRWVALARTGGSSSERKHKVMSSRSMVSLRDRVATIEADLKVFRSVLSAYELKNSAVSREITRRQTERQYKYES